MRVVSPGKYIAAIIPALQKFLMFQVKSVSRAGDGEIRYGPIPGASTLASGTIYPDPLNQWTLESSGVVGLEDLGGNKSDYIFYISKDRPDKLYKYTMHVYPEILKHVIFYPENQVQSMFQNTSFNPIDDIGTFSGEIEVLQVPNCKVGFQTFNPTNMTLYTMITLNYVEYTVDVVKDESKASQAIFNGSVVPEVLPIYVNSDYFQRDVLNRVYDGAVFDTSMLENVFFKEEVTKSEPFLLNVYGETDGTNTTGTFNLQSDAFSGTVAAITIPKGAKAKIWDVEVDGEPCTVAIEVVRGTTTTTVKTVTLASPGNLTKEYRSRPLVINSSQSDTTPTTIALAWQQVTAAKSTVSVDMEISY